MMKNVPVISGCMLTALALGACRADRDTAGGAPAAGAPGEVSVVGREYAFDAPDTLPSGWTTIAFANQGTEPHFLMLTELPDGRTAADYLRDVGGAFDSGWAALQAGASKADAGATIGRFLPAWYANARVMGGPGLVSPGNSVRTTLRLEPGTYVMECYVKTADGRFHTGLGMLHQLIVTDSENGAAPPDGDLALTVANTRLDGPDTVTAGAHIVAVHFAEQPEVGLGNDVHVAQVASAEGLDSLLPWMDWMNVDGLRTPAPVPFFGGTHEMPAGNTAYFTLDLAPGRYAWVPEGGDPSRAAVFIVR